MPSLISGVASRKLWGAKSEQQYFVWETASQSTKLQGMLEIWGGMAPLAPHGYAYAPNHH